MKTAQYVRLCFACLLGLASAQASSADAPSAVTPVAAPTAPPSPFVISADGTEVTDLRTELIWRRCVEGMSWDGVTCTGEPIQFTHEEALQRATAQAKASGVAWRMPNIKELSSLAQKGRRNPATDITAFPAAPFYVQTWSSTPYIGDTHNAWIFSFSYANLYPAGRTETEYVRLVRDSQ